MKLNLGSLPYASVFLLSLFSVFVSCEPDPEPDKEAPSITVTPPVANASIVKGNINIKAEVTDNQSIKTVKILVDGTEIEQLSSGDVDFSWDSKQVEDGEHTIQITAIDQNGNEQSSSFVINVLNYFIKFTVPENYDYASDERLFVSTAGGQFISMDSVLPGRAVKLETPDNYDPSETFVLTHFAHSAGDFTFNTIYSYVDFKPGTYRFKSQSPAQEIGNAKIAFSNFTADNPLFYGGGSAATCTSFGPENGKIVSNVSLTKSSSEVLAVAQTDIYQKPKFEFIEGVTANDFIDVDYNALNEFEIHSATVPSDVTSAYTVVTVPNDRGTFLASLYFMTLAGSGSQAIDYHVPGNLFDEYFFYSDYTTGSGYYGYYKQSSAAPESIQIIDAALTNFTQDNSYFDIAISGEADYKLLQGSVSTQNGYANWNVFMPGTASSSLTLTMPDVLSDEYELTSPHEFNFHTLSLVDFLDGIGDYAEYLNFLHKDDGLFSERVSEYRHVRIPLLSSGRQRQLEKPNAAAIQDRVKRILERGY